MIVKTRVHDGEESWLLAMVAHKDWWILSTSLFLRFWRLLGPFSSGFSCNMCRIHLKSVVDCNPFLVFLCSYHPGACMHEISMWHCGEPIGKQSKDHGDSFLASRYAVWLCQVNLCLEQKRPAMMGRDALEAHNSHHGMIVGRAWNSQHLASWEITSDGFPNSQGMDGYGSLLGALDPQWDMDQNIQFITYKSITRLTTN